MKKMAIVGMLIASLTTLVACDGIDVEAAQEQRMTCVEHTLYGDILCDNRTGVVYFAYNEGGRFETYSGFCPLVDQNGKPLVMEEKQ